MTLEHEWSSTLPEQPWGTELTPIQNVVRSTSDSGVMRARRRHNRMHFLMDIPDMRMNGEQIMEFIDWYINDLKNGAEPFKWESPSVDGVNIKCLFSSEPRSVLVVGADDNNRIWSVTMQFYVEVL